MMTVRTLVESGIIYTVSSASTLLVHAAAADHPPSYFLQTLLRAVVRLAAVRNVRLTDICSPPQNIAVAGISFNLILVRTGQERTNLVALSDPYRHENKGTTRLRRFYGSREY